MIVRKVAARVLRAVAEIIDKTEGEDMIEVAITKRDVNGKGIEGKAASRTSTVYVIARRIGYVEWEPLYAEDKATGEKKELPHGFTLRHDVTYALEEAR